MKSRKVDWLCSNCLKPIFQDQIPFILLSPYLKEYLNPQVSINTVDKHSVNYHVSPSGLTSRMHPLLFMQCFNALSFSRRFVEYCVNSVYLTMVEEDFQNCGVQSNGKCFLRFKKIEIRHYYLCPELKLVPTFLSATPRGVAHSFSQSIVFSKIGFPLSRVGQGWGL